MLRRIAHLRSLALLVSLFTFAGVARAQVHIDFEDGNAPCALSSAPSASDEYAFQGVHFSGPGTGDGGAIVKQCGNYGAPAHSGIQMLVCDSSASTTTGSAAGPLVIRFDDDVAEAGLWVSGGSGAVTIELRGYRSGLNHVTDSVSLPAGTWGFLYVQYVDGLDSVDVVETTNTGKFLVDDLFAMPMLSGPPVYLHFEDQPGPCNFNQAPSLSTEYLGMGVQFGSTGTGNGGAVLGDCGAFGINARSGEKFLAFYDIAPTQTGTAHDPCIIEFSQRASYVSIHASGGFNACTFNLRGYRNTGGLVKFDMVTAAPDEWKRLQIADPIGFDFVEIYELTDSGSWVADDLLFTFAPLVAIFCEGDPVTCPCAAGGAQAGCANSTGEGGRLLSQAAPSIQGDGFTLLASQCPPDAPGLFFQGNSLVNFGSGIPFGNGLRCAGGTTTRLQVRLADANGDAQSSISIATKGNNQPGDLRFYQFWYRDTANPCGGGFNFTNALSASWVP